MLQDRMRSDRVDDHHDEPSVEPLTDLEEEIEEFAAELRRGDSERLAIFMGGVLSDEVARAIYDLYDGTRLEEWFFERQYGGIDEAARSLLMARSQLEDVAPMQWAVDATSLVLRPHNGGWTDIEIRWNHRHREWETAVRRPSGAYTAETRNDPVESLETVLDRFGDELEALNQLIGIREMIETRQT